MKTVKFSEYWQDQRSSMNRGDDAKYYETKAAEHLALMTRTGPAAGVVDFGCGAGELLARFAKNYEEPIIGVDFSRPLLERAEQVLSGATIRLVEMDAGSYADVADQPRWMSCGAVNQYSNELELDSFIAAFATNIAARELFLFDTIEPVRFLLFRGGMIESYIRPGTFAETSFRKIPKAALCAYRALALALRDASVIPIGKMGYAVKLAYWRQASGRHGLHVEFVSSGAFEYRYHVVIRK